MICYAILPWDTMQVARGSPAVAAGRRSVAGYRQRLTALTATADSLSREIARVASTSARTVAGGGSRGHRETSGRRAAAVAERRHQLRGDLAVLPRLHPLVDHDYGAFATFNAEVRYCKHYLFSS